jgi:TonB family protein
MTASIRAVLLALLLLAPDASAQDALSAARELYASASYEEALSAFGRLKDGATVMASAEIDRYRALCLIALGRASEANNVIESIVLNDPLYQPAESDASPRVRSAFSAVRQRVLPGVARSFYVDGKAAFDRKAYPEAIQALEKTVSVIDNIEGDDKAGLGDLRVLAAGFLDLSRAAGAAPAPAANAAAAATPEPAAARPAAPPVTTNLVVLKQELPPVPFSLSASGAGEYRGIVEVEIDEAGNVTNSRIIQSVHAFYDPILLKAARDWKYEPPRVAGKPISSRKRVEVVLRL